MKGLSENSGSLELQQGKGFAASILVHLLIIAAFFSTSSKIQKPAKLMVVDFNILESPVQTQISQQPVQQPAVPVPPVVKPPEKIKVPTPPKPVLKKKVVKKSAKPVPVKKPQIAAIKPKPEPPVRPKPEEIPEPEVSLPEPQTQTQEPEPLLAHKEPAATTPVKPMAKTVPSFPLPAAGRAKVSDKTSVSRYTKSQFNHIQKGIQEQINYPRTARRMGWEGKVVVEFIICKDGTVKDLQIIESSGFKALDKNAVATIKKAAPFPIPPLPAKLIIPVIYRLS